MPTQNKTPGQAAYEAYWSPYKEWEPETKGTKKNWELVAKAAIRQEAKNKKARAK